MLVWTGIILSFLVESLNNSVKGLIFLPVVKESIGLSLASPNIGLELELRESRDSLISLFWLEIKLDYLKEKQYLTDIEKKLVRTEILANSINQQVVELRNTQEILKKLLEKLISRIG